MTETIVTIWLSAIGFYLFIGVIFYFFFMKKGIHQIDEGAKETPLFFKALVFPGIVALWPALLKKWNQVKKA